MSTDVLVGIVVAVTVVGVLAAIGVGFARAQRRRTALAGWAAQHGMTYAPYDLGWAAVPWGTPFGTPGGRACDVVTGPWNGRPAVWFTYRYSPPLRDRKVVDLAVYARPTPAVVPRLVVRPETRASGLLRAVGVHDVEVESEQFNRRYAVETEVPRLAYDVLSPPLMAWLLQTGSPGFRLAGGYAVLVQEGTADPSRAPMALAYLDELLSRVRPAVWTG